MPPNALQRKGKPRHPTLLDTPSLAGVAPMTLSPVIGQGGYVSLEMRQVRFHCRLTLRESPMKRGAAERLPSRGVSFES